MTEEVDRLQRSNQWREAYDYVKEYGETATDPELLWRVIRACYYVGKHLSRDKQESQAIATKGLEVSDRALKIDNNHFNLHRVSSCCAISCLSC